MTLEQISELEKRRDNLIYSAKKLELSKTREDFLYKYSCVKSAYGLQKQILDAKRNFT